MLGSNSGLLGVRRVPTTSSASGIWLLNEQIVAKRASIWPFTTGEVPTYVATGAYAVGRNSLVSSWPAGHQVGDLGIHYTYTSVNSSMVAPAGWTTIATASVASQRKLIVSYKYAASSSEANVSQTPGNYPSAAQISCFRSTASSSPIDVSGTFNANVTTTPTPTPVDVTTTDAKRYVVSIMTMGGSNVATPTDWVTIASTGANFTTDLNYEVSSSDSTNAPVGIVFVMGGVQATAGASPSATLTMNNTLWQNNPHCRVTFALKPVP